MQNTTCHSWGKMVDLLNEHSIDYDTFDILSDEDVRQGLKVYSNWPTYPQLYSKGKLIGGLDILKELAEEGALADELSAWDPQTSSTFDAKKVRIWEREVFDAAKINLRKFIQVWCLWMEQALWTE